MAVEASTHALWRHNTLHQRPVFEAGHTAHLALHWLYWHNTAPGFVCWHMVHIPTGRGNVQPDAAACIQTTNNATSLFLPTGPCHSLGCVLLTPLLVAGWGDAYPPTHPASGCSSCGQGAKHMGSRGVVTACTSRSQRHHLLVRGVGQHGFASRLAAPLALEATSSHLPHPHGRGCSQALDPHCCHVWQNLPGWSTSLIFCAACTWVQVLCAFAAHSSGACCLVLAAFGCTAPQEGNQTWCM
jgi:hypothetical protein